VCSVVDNLAVCDCAGTGFGGEVCDVALPPSVSVSFDDNATLAALDVAGDPQTTGWNNALGAGPGQGADGTLADLLDEGGASTGVSIDWSCQDIEVTPLSGGSAADQAMMGQGCRAWMGMGDATITLHGLNAHFASGYTVIAYVGHGGGFPTDHTATFTLNVGADTVSGAVLAAFDGTFDTLDGAGDAGNVYVSSAHTEDDLVITLAATGNATLPTAAINGLQVLATP